MIPAQSHKRDAAAQSCNSDRRVSLGRGAVANLAVTVVSPAQDPADDGHRTRMILAQSHHRNAAAQSYNRNGRCLFPSCETIANIAVGAASPARDPADAGHRTGKGTAQSDHRNTAAQSLDRYRGKTISRGAIANPAVDVASPARDPAAAGHRTRMIPSQSDHRDAATQTRNRNGRVAIRRAAVANLASTTAT